MIGNDPSLEDLTWEGEVELDLGDLGFQTALFKCEYSTDGNLASLGYYELLIPLNKQLFNKELCINVTEHLNEHAAQDLFNQYVMG